MDKLVDKVDISCYLSVYRSRIKRGQKGDKKHRGVTYQKNALYYPQIFFFEKNQKMMVGKGKKKLYTVSTGLIVVIGFLIEDNKDI